VRYSCIYWISHLCEINSSPQCRPELCDGGTVHMFVQDHFIHWLEALSLMKSVSDGMLAIAELKDLLKVSIWDDIS
jgi:hypothetical protein